MIPRKLFRIGACLITLGSAGPALSEVVRVQTGEHAAFTRLAMVFEAPVAWRAGRSEDGYILAFDTDTLTLDLDGAFRLIPRDRIAGLTWDAATSRLLIESDCACHLNAFELPDNILVVDIRTGETGGKPQFDVRLDAPPEQTETATADPEPRGAPPVDIPLLVRPTPVLPVLSTAREGTVPTEIDRMENQLLSALGAAAESGLIAVDAALPVTVAEDTAHGLPSEHVTSRVATQASGHDTDARVADTCPDPASVDVAAWGRGTPAQTYSAGRDALFDDLGRLDPAALTRRVRSLIHIGFGAEALSHLDMAGYRTRETEILRDLALIVDQVPDRQPHILGAAYQCPDVSALWAVLSGRAPSSMTALNGPAVQRSYMTLPEHLRKLLGTELVRNLRSAGADEPANAILEAMLRLPGTPAKGLSALVGEDRLSEGNTRSGEVALGVAAFDNEEDSPEALLTLLRAREARSATVPEDVLLLAESIAQELRGTRMSGDLIDAAARAHARDGRYEKAFALARMVAAESTARSADLRSDLAEKLARGAPDNVFLLHAFGEGLMLPTASLSQSARLATAQRLADLGFLVEADSLAASLPESEPDSQLLRARVAIARGFPDLALEHLADLDSTAARQLRARAQAAGGAAAQAATLYGEIGQQESAAAEAWASGDDALIATHGQANDRAFIDSLVNGPAGIPLPQQAQLAREEISQRNLQDLLSGTQSFRTAAEALLAQQRIGNE